VITNLLGEQVKKITAVTNQPITIQLDEPDGVYFVSAIANHQICAETLMLRK